MTLTELRYIVALARERHFGRAAEKCFVSQPTLSVAVKKLGRSPRHVLLLHENDLAALYLGDLVKKLRKTGWKIISPERAFQDPIASVEPDTLVLGQGRVIALATAKGYTGPGRRWEDEAMLQQEFERRRVWK